MAAPGGASRTPRPDPSDREPPPASAPRAARLSEMLARGLVVVGLAAALACKALPDVTVEADDAASKSLFEDGGPTLDARTDATASDATAPDASEVEDALGSVDANGDDAPASSMDSSTCPPSGAPAGTSCCPNGTPCIGP